MQDTGECKAVLKQCQIEQTDLLLLNQTSTTEKGKLQDELRHCRGQNQAANKNGAELVTNLFGFGALFLLLSIAFNIIQFFVNQQVSFLLPIPAPSPFLSSFRLFLQYFSVPFFPALPLYFPYSALYHTLALPLLLNLLTVTCTFVSYFNFYLSLCRSLPLLHSISCFLNSIYQTHAKENEASRSAAAFEAELNSLKSNPFHHHAQISYMKQFEKFSETQLGIDMRLKVLDAPLGIANGDGNSGRGGGGNSGGEADQRNGDGGCGSGGPPSIQPVQDTEGVNCRTH